MLELQDCYYPLVVKFTCTTDYDEGFKDAQAAILCGSKPRLPGEIRRDLLLKNAELFKAMG